MKSSFGYRRGPHWVAVFAAVFTLPLLYVGGSVTTYRVGLAVHDWPTTFGENMFAYDFRYAPFGVRVEHLHRLYGAAVGLATIVLAGWFLARERRRWLKGLGLLALAAVILQGVLGGLRVTRTSTLLAAVHGFTGQAFFGLMVALSVWTGRDWNRTTTPGTDPDHLRRRALVLLGLVYAQIALGGWLRHYGTPTALWTHGVLAAAVWVHAVFLAYRIERGRAGLDPLVGPARVLALASTLQVVLGLAAMSVLWPFDGLSRPVTSGQALIRTGHQTNAALLLAATIVVTLRAYRDLAGAATAAATGTGRDEGRSGRPEPAALDWEAVA
jgi:cytochrome c oxidase assembly protein subunit 15